jgi:hypothetical protein
LLFRENDMKELLTTKEVADRISSSPRATQRLLLRLKVRPYPLGRGKGLGLRWDWFEVSEALERLSSGGLECTEQS